MLDLLPCPTEGEGEEVKQPYGAQPTTNIRRGTSGAGKEDARIAGRGSGRPVGTDLAQKAPPYVGLGIRGGRLKWRCHISFLLMFGNMSLKSILDYFVFVVIFENG